jgi:crossover junction endodeoxyribonuclease RusA
MSGDDGLLMWQRIARERGEPIDVPPRQRRAKPQAGQQQLQTNSKINQNLEQPTPAAGHRIDLPWARPPLNQNRRNGRNPYAHAKIVAAIRYDVKTLAKAAKIPHYAFITVQLHYAPGRRGRRDPMNLCATSKPAIDGLVDAGVVDDDDTEHVHELPPEIHFPPEPGPRCWLIITPTKERPDG